MAGGMLPPGMVPSGELTSRQPTLEENTVDFLRRWLFTDDRAGQEKAERLSNVLQFTPVGAATDAYDIGKAGAEGNTADLMTAIILTLPGASKNKLESLTKMQGNRDLFEMYQKEGAWLDPQYDVVKTIVGPSDTGKDVLKKRFYDETNGLSRSPGDNIDKYFDMPQITLDPGLRNQNFRVLPGISSFNNPSTFGYFHEDTSYVYPDHVRHTLSNKSARAQQDAIKGTAFHELTHGSQQAANLLENTGDKYYEKYLKNAFEGVLPLPKETLDKVDEIRAAFPNFEGVDILGNKGPTDFLNNETGVLDFLGYRLHPLETEARAAEDMLLKPTAQRAESYLKGVDSAPVDHSYKTVSGLVNALHKLFVTGEIAEPTVVQRKLRP